MDKIVDSFILNNYIVNYFKIFGITIKTNGECVDYTDRLCQCCILVYNNEELRTIMKNELLSIFTSKGFFPIVRVSNDYIEFDPEHARIHDSYGVSSRTKKVFIRYEENTNSMRLSVGMYKKKYVVEIHRKLLGSTIITFSITRKDMRESINRTSISVDIGSDPLSVDDYFLKIKESLKSKKIYRDEVKWIDAMLEDTRVIHFFQEAIDSVQKPFDDVYQDAYNSICAMRDEEIDQVNQKWNDAFEELKELRTDYLSQQKEQDVDKKLIK